MIRILTITSNDLGISWGPAVHFLELWNIINEAPNISADGVAPSWVREKPIIEPRFNLYILNIPNIKKIRQIIYDYKVARKIIDVHKNYDLLYIRLSHWHLFTFIVLKMLNLPFFLELNGLAREDSKSSKKTFLFKFLISLTEKALINNAKIIIAVSGGIKKQVENLYRKGSKTHVISNGVSDKLFEIPRNLLSSKKQIRVIYVGTFTPWDGSDLIPKLAAKFPECQFIMVGDGINRYKIQVNAPPNMVFVGFVPYTELHKQYSKADCAIVLYEFDRHRNVELSSLKTREYVAAGLPIFSTMVPGQEFIKNLEIGHLLHEGDDIEQQFAYFLSRLDFYMSNCIEVRKTIRKNVSWKTTADETIRLINEYGLS